jgi:hypothetical protein
MAQFLEQLQLLAAADPTVTGQQKWQGGTPGTIWCSLLRHTAWVLTPANTPPPCPVIAAR